MGFLSISFLNDGLAATSDSRASLQTIRRKERMRQICYKTQALFINMSDNRWSTYSSLCVCLLPYNDHAAKCWRFLEISCKTRILFIGLARVYKLYKQNYLSYLIYVGVILQHAYYVLNVHHCIYGPNSCH